MEMDIIFVDLSVLLISSIIATVIFALFSLRSGRLNDLQADYNKSFAVIDVIKSLGKISPVNAANKWHLLPMSCGLQRCWIQRFLFPIMDRNINLYGSSAVVKCSSLNAFALISDVSKWEEWNPQQFPQYVVNSFHDKQLRRDHYMVADQIVGIQRGTNVQSYVAMYRFLNMTDKNVGWILLWNAKKLEFFFYLVQPIISDNDYEKCMVTHIFGADFLKDFSYSASLVVQRLRNIQDFISTPSLTTMPLPFSSHLHTGAKENYCDNSNPFPKNYRENSTLYCIQASKGEAINTLFILVPFSYYKQCTFKSLKGFHLAVKSYNNLKSKMKISKKSVTKENMFIAGSRMSQHKLRRTASDISFKRSLYTDLLNNSLKIQNSNVEKNYNLETKENNPGELSVIQEENIKVQNDLKHCEDSIQAHTQRLRSLSETAISNAAENQTFVQSNIFNSSNEDSNSLEVQTTSKNNVIVMDKQNQNELFSSSLSDFEILDSGEELSDCRIAYFKTQGNYGASELQAELLLVSEVQENCTAAGGWIYHSSHKGIKVFMKTVTSRFMKVSSFLCQTEMHLSPKDAWKFVKNPRVRFICDETVKSVKIIDKFSNSQKLLHIYHETSGILWKELVDFCLLHTERLELNRYYCAFHSIEYEKCPFMDSVTRGILRPSGWIVEEVENNPQKCKVTFIMQILINSPDSLYFQELGTLVPQSLYNLIQYATSKPV